MSSPKQLFTGDSAPAPMTFSFGQVSNNRVF
jgi:hypothetical protein